MMRQNILFVDDQKRNKRFEQKEMINSESKKGGCM